MILSGWELENIVTTQLHSSEMSKYPQNRHRQPHGLCKNHFNFAIYNRTLLRIHQDVFYLFLLSLLPPKVQAPALTFSWETLGSTATGDKRNARPSSRFYREQILKCKYTETPTPLRSGWDPRWSPCSNSAGRWKPSNTSTFRAIWP